MSYSVYLFGLDGVQVAEELSNDNLTERVLSRFREVRSPSASDLAVVSEILAQGLGGNWPDDGTVDPFETFCWVMDVLAEPIVIECLRDFRSLDYFEDMELWPYFLRHPAPFPVPTTSDAVPRVGFLPRSAMPELLDVEADRFHEIDALCRGCREEWLEVIESLSDDGLDLLAVLSLW